MLSPTATETGLSLEEIVVGAGAALAFLTFTFYYFTSRRKKQKEPLDSTDRLNKTLREVGRDTDKIRPEEVGEATDSFAGETTDSFALPELGEVTDDLTKRKAEAPAEKPILLDDVLKNTRQGFLGKIQNLFSNKASITLEDLAELEEILYSSDLGPKTVDSLMSAVSEKMKNRPSADFNFVKSALREEMKGILDKSLQGKSTFDDGMFRGELAAKPLIWLIVGVNGVGKTTTIGKLARKFSQEGKKVLVAAGDTFRAAARDQLAVWSDRAEVAIHSPDNVSDPAAIAFEACEKAKSQSFDVVIIDTAGRLHTKSNLMEELKKVKRVIAKSIASAPHEVLMVIDANTGQNAIHQTKTFHEALGVTGVILTKLDGTAKGGVAVGLANEFGIPIRWIGVGERVQDLRSFSPTEFISSII